MNPTCCSSTKARQRSAAPLTAAAERGRLGRALSVNSEEIYQSWLKAMANKVIRPTDDSPPTGDRRLSADNASCNCSSIDSVANPYLSYLAQRARDYAISTSAAIGYLYAPMLIHLDQELGELYRLARTIAYHDRTVHTISQAQRGLSNAQQSVTGAFRLVRKYVVDEYTRGHGLESEKILRLRDLARSTWDTMKRRVDAAREMVLMAQGDRQRLNDVVRHAQEGMGELFEHVHHRAERVTEEAGNGIRRAKIGLDNLLGKASPGIQSSGMEETEDAQVQDVSEGTRHGIEQDGDPRSIRLLRTSRRSRFDGGGRSKRDRARGARGTRRRPSNHGVVEERTFEHARRAEVGGVRKLWRGVMGHIHHVR